MFYFIRKSNKIWWIFFKKVLCSNHCSIHLRLPTEMCIKIAHHTHKWRLPREKLALKDSLCLSSWTLQTSWSWPEKAPGRIHLMVCSFFLLEQKPLVKSESMLPFFFFTPFLWTQRSKEYTIWKLGSFPVPPWKLIPETILQPLCYYWDRSYQNTIKEGGCRKWAQRATILEEHFSCSLTYCT